MKVLGRVGFPPFECKGPAAFTFHGQDVVEVEPFVGPIRPLNSRPVHCEDCATLREHARANPLETCWCVSCGIAAQHQADLRAERQLQERYR